MIIYDILEKWERICRLGVHKGLVWIDYCV